MNRHEIEYYKNIERIATALEKLVAQGKEEKLERFKQASNVLYGNDATVNPAKKDSEEKYTYPQFVAEHYTAAAEKYLADVKDGMDLTKATDEYTKAVDAISKNEMVDAPSRTELEQRMYDESQKLTGAEFQGWFDKLNQSERDAYTSVYNF